EYDDNGYFWLLTLHNQQPVAVSRGLYVGNVAGNQYGVAVIFWIVRNQLFALDRDKRLVTWRPLAKICVGADLNCEWDDLTKFIRFPREKTDRCLAFCACLPDRQEIGIA